MASPAQFIKRIEIRGLWHRLDIAWDLRPDVNILSGVNGIGKTTILRRSVHYLETAGSGKAGEERDGVRITFDPAEATTIPYDVIRSYAYSSDQAQLLDELLQRYKACDVAATDRHMFQELVDRLFGHTFKTIDRHSSEIAFLQGGERLLPDKLSSGEKQMLIILLTVLLRGHAHCVLFMDEPEVSLHIEWQQKLISFVRELNPNVQLVISTHSPALIMEGWLDAVTEVSDISTPTHEEAAR
ncbi:MAG: AAA family ATPase [Mediterranea sp.]|nr:AAA family ATPase [Mediterranea sp.]